MKLEFWGIRGTTPVWGNDKKRYGGHTLCSLITSDEKDLIIIDAGTGIMQLGNKLLKDSGSGELHIHLLLTHFHLDHIMGMPFFPLLYHRNAFITFYSPVATKEMEGYLSGLMRGKYFPVDFMSTSSKKEYIQVEEGGFRIGDIQITAQDLNHPQGSVAYKFLHKEKTIILATDTEHPEAGIDQKLAEFCSGADVLVYDAMFTPEEYADRKGWGHSTWRAGTQLAEMSGIKTLYLSHLSPDHSDQQIDAILETAQKEFPQSHIPAEES